MMLLPLVLLCSFPFEAEVVLELVLPGDAWVRTVCENHDGSYTLKITRARRDYGGECTWVDIRDFDFLTLDSNGDTLSLITHPSTDAYMLWDVLEMDEGAGYILYGDYREIPDDIGESRSDWYFNDTFPFSEFQVTRVSPAGDTLWTMGWNEDSLANGLSARLLYDNSVLALTEVTGPDGEAAAHLQHIDETGTLLWKLTIPDWDGVYPHRIACSRNSVVVSHGREINRHLLLDLDTGEVLRVDTLPPGESIYVVAAHRMNRSDLLVCNLGSWTGADMHPAILSGEGTDRERIRTIPALVDHGPVGWSCSGCEIDSSSWAMLCNGGWENPLISLIVMDGLDTVTSSCTLAGMTGLPDPGYLRDNGPGTNYDDSVEWDYRPAESLQYTGAGRFVLGINNSIMLEMAERMGCVFQVVEVVLDE